MIPILQRGYICKLRKNKNKNKKQKQKTATGGLTIMYPQNPTATTKKKRKKKDWQRTPISPPMIPFCTETCTLLETPPIKHPHPCSPEKDSSGHVTKVPRKVAGMVIPPFSHVFPPLHGGGKRPRKVGRQRNAYPSFFFFPRDPLHRISFFLIERKKKKKTPNHPCQEENSTVVNTRG